MYEAHRVQWTLSVTIFHGPSFGHAIELVTETKGRPEYSTHDTIGKWRGIGCPSDVLDQARGMVDTALLHHIVTRYGVQESLPQWPDEVDPF